MLSRSGSLPPGRFGHRALCHLGLNFFTLTKKPTGVRHHRAGTPQTPLRQPVAASPGTPARLVKWHRRRNFLQASCAQRAMRLTSHRRCIYVYRAGSWDADLQPGSWCIRRRLEHQKRGSTRPWSRVNERDGPSRACLPGIFGPGRMEGREQCPQSVKRFGVGNRVDPCSQRGLHC